MFSKDFYCRHIKNQGLFGKGLRKAGVLLCDITLTTCLKKTSMLHLTNLKLGLHIFSYNGLLLGFVNFFSNDKILDQYNLKAFADHKF